MSKLTVKQLESLSHADVGRKLFDGNGLYGRVREQKTGVVVTFEFRFKLQCKERTTSCGKWPVKSLREIRKTRDAKRSMVEEGNDPNKNPRRKRTGYLVLTARTVPIDSHYVASDTVLPVLSHSCLSFLHYHACQPCSQNNHLSKTRLPITASLPGDNV